MNNFDNSFNSKDERIDLIKELHYYAFFWPWFILSILILLASAYTYIRYSPNVYSTSAILQVKDAQSDPSSFLSQSNSSMFNFNRVKIDNYITQINSKPNLEKVIELLDLQTTVNEVGNIKNTLRFGNEIPFEIEFKNNKLYRDGFLIKFENNQAYLLIDEEKYFSDSNSFFKTDDFIVRIKSIPKEDVEYLIQRTSKEISLAIIGSLVKVQAKSGEGDNISINFDGQNIYRNEAIINTLIDVAQQAQVDEKKQVYTLSIDFINSRLFTIVNEIDSLSLETIGFKSENLIFSPEAQITNALSNLSDLEQEKFNLTTQLELAKSLKDNIKQQSDFSLLPSNIGINSGNVNELVLAYNNLVLERNGLLSSATEKNPLVIQISEKLSDLKQNIFISIENYLRNLQTSLNKFKEFEGSVSDQVSRIPELDVSLSAFQRKFQLAENLYLFLLERREEASISSQSVLPNTRIINYSNTNPVPVSPKNNLIYVAALVLGLFIPLAIIFILRLLDTKFHTREDLVSAMPNVDILGEIPYVENMDTISSTRGVLAESTRIIRSNIVYKLFSDDKSKIILVTSSIKGEGKTLTAFNLASSYAASGKKVVLLGADLRNPQLHRFTNKKRKDNLLGLSSILVDPNIKYKDLIETVEIFSCNIDIVNSGAIPPNPAELLGSKLFENLLENLKKDYDYILIDSAPLLLVSDTLPLLRFADLVLFNVRSGHTDKSISKFILDTIKGKNLKNVGLILNGIKAGANSYLKYGYSYRYSYSYKYNYGYGYGYGKD